MMPAGLTRLVPAIRVLAGLGSIALVTLVALRAGRRVDFSNLTWWPLAPAVVAAAAWWLLLARGWAVLVSGRANRGDVRTWCRTQALRYLPGGIWAPVSRVAVAPGNAVDRLVTVGAENVVALCCALGVAGLAMTIGGRPAYAPAMLAPLLPWTSARLLGSRMRMPTPRVRGATVNDLIAFVLYAGCAVAVQASASGLQAMWQVAGAAALAWAAGLVVVLAPGGIGVREVAYVGLVGSALPSSELALGAVAMRLVMIGAELGVLLATAVPRRRRSATSRPAP
jgi:hypothetical protein